MVHSFFFYCYVVHRDLHSFPTRRSSDLEVGDETTEILLEAANFEPIGILRSSERLALRTAGSNRWEKDRKSTRLNSSHTVSSYAVFCLKKKRIQVEHPQM